MYMYINPATTSTLHVGMPLLANILNTTNIIHTDMPVSQYTLFLHTTNTVHTGMPVSQY